MIIFRNFWAITDAQSTVGFRFSLTRSVSEILWERMPQTFSSYLDINTLGTGICSAECPFSCLPISCTIRLDILATFIAPAVTKRPRDCCAIFTPRLHHCVSRPGHEVRLNYEFLRDGAWAIAWAEEMRAKTVTSVELEVNILYACCAVKCWVMVYIISRPSPWRCRVGGQPARSAVVGTMGPSTVTRASRAITKST